MTHSYILAELLKRNTELHGKELRKRGNYVNWPWDARKIIITELLRYPLDSRLKAHSGYIWGKLRTQDITTRQIYQLLLQWALKLTERKELFTYTEHYKALLDELQGTISGGADGKVEDIDPQEIIEEWEFMRDNYLEAFERLVGDLSSKSPDKRIREINK